MGDGNLLGDSCFEPCGLHSRDADYGKPLGVDSCGADRDGDGVCGVCLQVGGLTL